MTHTHYTGERERERERDQLLMRAITMAEKGSKMRSFFLVLLCVTVVRFECLEAGLVPAVYVFGDSLVDVGNNNYIPNSFMRADFPHNGIDFPTGKATGRFSNGKNSVDFLVEKVGLPASPPYLSIVSKSSSDENTISFITGVSFASGGAGIFNETNNLFHQTVALTQQVDYFSSVYQELVRQLGSSGASLHLSKSLFVAVIGSNDIYGYSESSDLRNKYTPQQYLDSMVLTLEAQLKRLYGYGGRKFVISGIAVIGCTPSQRIKSNTETDECNTEVNQWGVQYNEGLKAMLQRLKMGHNDINYSYFDGYAVMSNILQTPSSFGFVEIKEACCGLGRLRADVPCLPIALYCPNRDNHLFWDPFHPTQETHSIFADVIFDGHPKYTYPITMKQLIAL